MGGPGLVNMALYGGMMFTYSKDVAKRKMKECKEKGTGGGGAGTPSGGSGTEGSQIPAAAEATSSGNSGQTTEGAKEKGEKESDEEQCSWMSPCCWLRKIGKWFFSSGGDGSGGNTNPSSDTT
ncbi:hypothetical protein BgAZ_402750 [Babesia gibsoni]|uniref:Uncharacterized protein n=1 Tax=Babesia gibsoni TaxID=33632 RepID=A0AAD8P855_BABGI|nr:hypothetical protein BgAZ_402750 [Babesia gibsoni]